MLLADFVTTSIFLMTLSCVVPLSLSFCFMNFILKTPLDNFGATTLEEEGFTGTALVLLVMTLGSGFAEDGWDDPGFQYGADILLRVRVDEIEVDVFVMKMENARLKLLCDINIRTKPLHIPCKCIY